MGLNILKQVNWVDVLAAVIFIRIAYVSLKSSLFAEFFKILGTILAIYLSAHYFTSVSDFIRGRVSLKEAPLEFLDFLCFSILAFAGYAIFMIMRVAIARLIKMEPVAQLDRWGGLALGLARAFLVSGLVIFMLTISSVSYIRKNVFISYSGDYLLRVVPAVYAGIWDNLVSKFMTKEKYNVTITEIQDGFYKK